MKKDIWKIMVCILLGVLSTQVKLLGCYPLVALWFVAVYMEEFYRGAFMSFMWLWMILFLPIASMLRYGIALLVWVVVLAVAERMNIYLKRIVESILAGLIMVLVYYGGTVLMATRKDKLYMVALEGMLIAGGGYFLSLGLSKFVQWELVKEKKTKGALLPQQARKYKTAMSYLAKSMEDMVKPQEQELDYGKIWKEELRQKICRPCQSYDLCFSQVGNMSLVLDELIEQVEKGEEVDKELKNKLYIQCQRAEVMLLEALRIFEKMELNSAWYRRLCEHREMIAGQIDAMAEVMGDCIEEEKLCDDKESPRLFQIRYHLREAGLKVYKIHYYQRKNGSCRITVEMSAKYGNCVAMREVLERMNRCSALSLISDQENRSIVGREKCVYTFLSKPLISCQEGVAKMVQSGQDISGDSFRAKHCGGTNFVVAISDGMGSGRQANRESETVVELLVKFVEAGFSMETTLRLMNAAMIFGAEKERFSTLDVCIVDEYTGIVDFYKVGAHVSFIKHKNSVELIDAQSLPMGAAVTMDVTPQRGYLQPGDCLVMVTDGVLEYLHVEYPVELMQDLINELVLEDAASFSRRIMERILMFTGGKVQDDMTVLTIVARER